MLGLGLSLNKSMLTKQIKLEKLVSDAGGVLYLDARKATGTQPPINSPLTQTWVDLSGNNNNATEKNMAGTITSGVYGTNLPFWMFDGIDDCFDMANTSSINISTAPLAIFATIKPNNVSINQYILCKDTSSSTDAQYGFYITNTAGLAIFLDGQQRAYLGNGSFQINKIYNIGFIWNSDGTIKPYLNGNLVSGGIGSYINTLTAGKPYVRLGCRATSSTSNAVFFNGGIATITIYTGSKATEVNVLKAEKAISKDYLI